MRRFLIVVGTIVCLSSCQQFTTGINTVAEGCAAVLPLAKVASLIPGIPASVAAYVIIGCETAEGLAKLNADPTSVQWLSDMDAKLRDLLKKHQGNMINFYG